MNNNIKSHIKPSRLNHLPDDLRQKLKSARTQRGLTQSALGRLVGLPQMHISALETGKIVPRFNTLLDLVRVLDQDLLMVPKELVPMIHSLIRDYGKREKSLGDGGGTGSGRGYSDGSGYGGDELPLYAVDADDEAEEQPDET